jgi:formylglycine-generating enzyme required for sulfatase activity
MARKYSAILTIAVALFADGATASADEMLVSEGNYPQFLLDEPLTDDEGSDGRNDKKVEAFYMDVFPVTNADFRDFVAQHPKWQKSKIPTIFADRRYLSHWESDLSFEPRLNLSPVTQISWFAAKAYCEWRGGSLPTIDQWEYVAFNRGKDKEAIFNQSIDWFSRPNPTVFPAISDLTKNEFGIAGIYGVIWEWTSDFNSFMSPTDGREGNGSDLFCGGGSRFANDKADYPRFMRYAFRSSLKASYTIRNLGFRCVRSFK